MGTNPIPEGTKNMGLNLPKPMYDELKKLAQKSGISVNRYIRTILETCIENGVEFEVKIMPKQPITFSRRSASTPEERMISEETKPPYAPAAKKKALTKKPVIGDFPPLPEESTE